MADTDFYNLNVNRAYPFSDPWITTVSPFEQKIVADLGLVLLPAAGFDLGNANHQIYPYVAGLDGGVHRIKLRVVAAGAAVDGLDITISRTSPTRFLTERFTVVVAAQTVGFGYLVWGDVKSAPTIPGSLPVFAATSQTSRLERNCIQVQRGHYVDRLVLANEPRTTYPECQSSSSAGAGGYSLAPRGERIVGDVVFEEGYNCAITVLTSANALRFSARKGAGAGEACTEIPRTAEEETALAAGETLDRAKRCHEAFTNFNGITPDLAGNLTLRGERGIVVDSPAAHTLRIAGRDAVTACGN